MLWPEQHNKSLTNFSGPHVCVSTLDPALAKSSSGQ